MISKPRKYVILKDFDLKITATILLCFTTALPAFLQSTINGRVLDSLSSNPMEYVVVVGYNAENEILESVSTDSLGKFSFKNAKIQSIEAQFLGFLKKRTLLSNLVVDNFTILLKPSAASN